MTATLPPVVDFYGGATAAQHADRIADITTALAADCSGMNVRLAACEVHLNPGRSTARLMVASADTAAVDRLADAYGLGPAGLHDDTYDRAGDVLVNGDEVFVRVLCSRPPTPSALPVASERADTALAVTR